MDPGPSGYIDIRNWGSMSWSIYDGKPPIPTVLVLLSDYLGEISTSTRYNGKTYDEQVCFLI
jgi:hypothetical protein